MLSRWVPPPARPGIARAPRAYPGSSSPPPARRAGHGHPLQCALSARSPGLLIGLPRIGDEDVIGHSADSLLMLLNRGRPKPRLWDGLSGHFLAGVNVCEDFPVLGVLEAVQRVHHRSALIDLVHHVIRFFVLANAAEGGEGQRMAFLEKDQTVGITDAAVLPAGFTGFERIGPPGPASRRISMEPSNRECVRGVKRSRGSEPSLQKPSSSL